MAKNTVTTIGGATRDIMFYTDDFLLIDNKEDLLRQKLMAFEYGAKIYSKKVFDTYGGGGANTAVSFAGLGIRTQTLLALGDDFVGKDYLNYLKKKSVATNFIQVKKGEKTAQSFIIASEKHRDRTIFVFRGASSSLDVSKVAKINTPWIYLSSLPTKANTKLGLITDHCARNHINIAWNPGHSQLLLGLGKLKKFAKDVTVFNVNRDEALELALSSTKEVSNNAQFLLKKLHTMGQKFTVITDGPKGAYLYDGQTVHFRPAQKKKGINTTGAGDSFGSGLVAGLIKYRGDIDRALKLAIYQSNSVIMKIGAQEGLLKQKDLTKLKI